MRTRLLLAVALLAALVTDPAMLTPRGVDSYPLRNFTVNRYSRLELSPGVLRVRYVLDMAEIPAFQERGALDADRNGRVDDGEAATYAARQAAVLCGNLRLNIDGGPVALRPVEAGVTLPPGQGGLDTLRFAAWYQGALLFLSGTATVDYQDGNYADRLGW